MKNYSSSIGILPFVQTDVCLCSRTFKGLYDKIKNSRLETMIVDSAIRSIKVMEQSVKAAFSKELYPKHKPCRRRND